MSDSSTKKLLRPFIQDAPAPMFFSGFFQSPPENFHVSEDVEIDIQRDGEDVAVAITNLQTGYRENANSKGTNKKFTPPAFKERFSLNGFQLMSREPGQNPFAEAGFQAKAIVRVGRGSKKCTNKIRRAVELMASQVLQSGEITLTDENGVDVYTLDFSPKASHVKTTDDTWELDGSGGDPLGDLEELADSIRTDGLHDPDVLVFGGSAWNRFIANAKVQKAVSRDGLGLGQLAPQKRGKGATFQGFVWIGSYRFEMWTYTGGYVHPQTKAPTKYLGSEKVVMMSQAARLDLTFGAIPKIVPEDGRVLQFMPQRVSDSESMIDLTTSAWVTEDNETLVAQVGSRPLTIPTEIDSFACLDVTQ